jgi:tRNA A37 threonylcarbamoyladenosine modification protein TsaB
MRLDSKKYYAALDLSGPCSSFSLLDVEAKIVLETKSILLGNRNNFSFFNVLFSTLKELNVDLDEITGWFIGIGPGSFTGLRIVSSFVSGIIFGKSNIKVNAIPSAFPMAAKINSLPGDRIGVLYYASRGEVLIYDIENNSDGVLVSKRGMVLAGKEKLLLELNNFEHIVYMNNKFIAEVLPEQLMHKVDVFDTYPVELLFEDRYIIPNYSQEDLIYVRPATVTS